MTLTYRSPTASDILHVAENMRQEDILEVAASHGHTPLQALAFAVTASDRSFAAMHDGSPVCIFGFSQHAEGIASVWLLGTDAWWLPRSAARSSEKLGGSATSGRPPSAPSSTSSMSTPSPRGDGSAGLASARAASSPPTASPRHPSSE